MNTQIQQIVKMFLNYPQLLQSWSATEFVFLSEECVGFKVSTPNYNGTVIIAFQDNSFYSVSFRDLEFKILGITGAEEVLDAVKDSAPLPQHWQAPPGGVRPFRPHPTTASLTLLAVPPLPCRGWHVRRRGLARCLRVSRKLKKNPRNARFVFVSIMRDGDTFSAFGIVVDVIKNLRAQICGTIAYRGYFQ